MTIELNNNVYADGGNDTETTPVVLVHGFPVDHRMWDECATALRDQAVKQGVKPFAIWLRICPAPAKDRFRPTKTAAARTPTARSRTDWTVWRRVRGPAARRRLRQGHLVGLSMGGYLILDIQRLHPEAVAALALCDTKADADSADMRLKRVAIATDCENDRHTRAGHGIRRAVGSRLHREAVGRLLQAVRNVDQRTAADGIAWRERMAAGVPT